MEAVHSAKPPRRWSKRSVVLAVSSLIGGVVVLVMGVVGFARSIGFVMGAVDGVGDVGQIAPQGANPARNGVTAARTASGITAASSVADSSPSLGGTGGSDPGVRALPGAVASVAAVSVVAGSGGAAATRAAEGGPLAEAGAVSGSGGASSGETGGSGGASGAAPSFWENVVESALAFVGQTTVSMCGPNTCNTGQVCCNPSCGICVAPGSTCSRTPCAGGPRTPSAVRCGATQCNDGLVCCNASCGICAAPGESCSDQKCE